jgi:hypothetical protein
MTMKTITRTANNNLPAYFLGRPRSAYRATVGAKPAARARHALSLPSWAQTSPPRSASD